MKKNEVKLLHDMQCDLLKRLYKCESPQERERLKGQYDILEELFNRFEHKPNISKKDN